MKKALMILFMASLFFACQQEDEIQKGTVVFNNEELSGTLKSAALNFDEVTHAVITIIDANDDTVKQAEKIELYKIDGQILSYPLELKVGNYELTDFYLVDANNNIIYIAPKKDSPMAAYAINPLNIAISISANNETKTTVEVMNALQSNPTDFGYAEFDASIINTFDIFVTAFEYNSANNTFELTNGLLKVIATDFELNDTLEAINNVVKIKDSLDSYQLIFTRNGAEVLNQVFTYNELKAYEIQLMKPLKIYVNGKKTVFQPASEGIDAFLHGLPSERDKNFGTNPQLPAFTWTFQGTEGTDRSLIDFNLSSLPANAVLISAKLTLYAWTRPDGFEHHSTLSGSNASVIQKVTSTWNESTVTWNTQPTTTTENEVRINKNYNDGEDFIDIEVTALIKDKLNASNYYGMMLKLQTEEYYRCLNFCSSDEPDASKHPKLVIEYAE